MAPKKKLSKKEKARLEAEQLELLRIEMEKERLKKLEEERERKKIESENAKRRQKEEILENHKRRTQLKDSMRFFNVVRDTIESIKSTEEEQRNWDKFMRCNGLPNANSPSDLRNYFHQWRSDIAQRNKESRNWLLRTDERTLLTQDTNVPDLSRVAMRKQQGNLGDVYAHRIREVLGILTELDDAIADKKKPVHIKKDLVGLKMEIRVFLSEHLDEFTYKTMSNIERDMEIDRPGVSKHIYNSDVFQSQFWTYSKDAQISLTPKLRVGEQNQPIEIDFKDIDMQIALPPTVKLPTSAMRGLWLNYDHFSDNCPTFNLKKRHSEDINIFIQTKREWRKRKDIMQEMIDDCVKESPLSLGKLDQEISDGSQQVKEQSFDVDKVYAAYEDELMKARKCAIGPDAYGMAETDVNLRKYRIIGGVYCIDYLETPQQDKRLNAYSFIRTITSPDKLEHKVFFQTFKPPPPPQPGVRRLPEEIEAEMRKVEAALDKLALVTVQMSDDVIWFEPPIACRWESKMETFESELLDRAQPKPPTTATPTETTSLSSTANPSPLKSSPRFPAKLRKRHSQKLNDEQNLPIREVADFDMLNIPTGIDIYGLLKDFVVPRLPQGFRIRLPPAEAAAATSPIAEATEKEPRVLFLARHRSENITRSKDDTKTNKALVDDKADRQHLHTVAHITEDFLDLDEPREFFADIKLQKVLKFKDSMQKDLGSGKKGNVTNGNSVKKTVTLNENGNVKEKLNDDKNKDEHEHESIDENVDGLSDSTKESSSSTKEEDKCYMFSQLIEDLDRLCDIQMPLLQEEAVQRISENLMKSIPASAASSQDIKQDKNDTEQHQQQHTSMDLMQPAFEYFPGMSFVRDLEAKNAANGKDSQDNGNTNEAALNDSDSSSDNSENGSEYEYAAEYEGEEGAAYYNNHDDNTIKRHLNSFGATSNAAAAATNSDGAAATATSSLVDFLNKHNQSDNDSTNSGKTSKVSSNFDALTKGKWSTRDVHDTKFNEDKLSIQFRTGRLGIFGFALNRYTNMPYQAWEIKPDLKCPGSILFSFTASIISLDMTITSFGYCVNNFQGGTTQAINDMIGKTFSLAELKQILITSAVDIFPDEDAFCYTEGSCEKNYIMEMHLYACISTLAQSHNFSWSRWNLLAGSRTAVLLIRELQEGKKIPNHSTLLVTPLKTAIIDCTEVSASFNSAGIAGMEFYADLYQLSQVHAQPKSLEKQRNMDPVLRDNVARILMAIRPLSFC